MDKRARHAVVIAWLAAGSPTCTLCGSPVVDDYCRCRAWEYCSDCTLAWLSSIPEVGSMRNALSRRCETHERLRRGG